MTTTNVEVSTKLDARATASRTNLTLNWDGMTEDEIRALAQQALVVKLQGKWRAAGSIPEELTVKVTDHKIGVRAPRGPVDPVALFKAMTPEQRAEFLAKVGAA